jgi:hypothetical protein
MPLAHSPSPEQLVPGGVLATTHCPLEQKKPGTHSLESEHEVRQRAASAQVRLPGQGAGALTTQAPCSQRLPESWFVAGSQLGGPQSTVG